MKLSVTLEAMAVFPELEVQGLVVDGFGAAVRQIRFSEVAAQVSRAAEAAVVGVGLTDLARSWRPAYQAMELKPSKFLSSVEALLKRAQAGEEAWRTGVPAIDVYNAASILHGAPLGGYDLAKLAGRDIEIRPFRRETDRFEPVGGQVNLSKGGDGLLVYAAGNDVLCWALNHRDSAGFCLEPDTGTALLMSESVTGAQAEASRAALSELAGWLQGHGATVRPLQGVAHGVAAVPSVAGADQ